MENRFSRDLLHKAGFISLSVIVITAAFWMSQVRSPRVVKAQNTLGGPLPGLTQQQLRLFNEGLVNVQHQFTVSQGLGPVYAQNSCTSCHSNPASGGNSTGTVTYFGTTDSDGTFDPLISEGGEILQAVSIEGEKRSCKVNGEKIPRNATIVAAHQAPQAFGMGLIDAIPATSILAEAVDKGMGVHGIANMVPDENGNTVVGRHGYKSQLADVLETIAFAMINDIGVTTPVYPNENLPQGHSIPPGCDGPPEPNDNGSQLIGAYHFINLLAPNPFPSDGNRNGQALFTSVGCALCHLSSYTTGPNFTVQVTYGGKSIVVDALSNQHARLYSDLLLHDMNPALADNIPMYLASGSMFRTTPLWGLSTRIASGLGLMHDGSAKTVNAAIADHGGEATQVLDNFNALSSGDQSDLIAFISAL